MLLAAVSRPFECLLFGAMREGGQNEVVLRDVSPHGLALCLRYVHGLPFGRLSLDEAFDVFEVADMYEIRPLLSFVFGVICSEVTAATAVDILRRARARRCDSVEEAVRSYMCCAFDEFGRTEDFLQLPLDVVEALLASDELEVEHEAAVARALVRWVSACPSRHEHLDALLARLRWVHIDADFLQEELEAWSERPGHVLQRSAVLPRMLLEAYKYQAASAARRRRLLRLKPCRCRHYRRVTQFAYDSDFDTGGILYHIATDGATRPWRNPAETGRVTVHSSQLCKSHFDARCFVGRTFRKCYTARMPNAFYMVDLGPAHHVIPAHYTLLQGGGNAHLMRWELQGAECVDGPWTTLRRHEEKRPVRARKSCSWSIDGATTAFRVFRVIQTGEGSSSGLGYLGLCGFEVYGTLLEYPEALVEQMRDAEQPAPASRTTNAAEPSPSAPSPSAPSPSPSRPSPLSLRG